MLTAATSGWASTRAVKRGNLGLTFAAIGGRWAFIVSLEGAFLNYLLGGSQGALQFSVPEGGMADRSSSIRKKLGFAHVACKGTFLGPRERC